MTEQQQGPVSNTRLYALATSIGAIGMLLILAQATWMVPRQNAEAFLLIIYLGVPFVTPMILALMPRQRHLQLDTRYEWRWPVVWIELGLPATLTLISLTVIGVTDDFDHISGLPMFLALVVGDDLTLLIRCLWMERDARNLHGKKP